MIIIIAALVAFVPITLSSPAYACEATGKPGPPSQDWIDQTAAIFSGRVVEIRNITIGSYDQHAVFFEVDRYWKSPNPTENDEDYYKELVVRTNTNDGACGYDFEIGKSYLVYALPGSSGASSLYTSLAYGNKPIEEAREDIAALGEGIVPTKDISWEKQISRTSEISSSSPPRQTEQERTMNLISFIGIGGATASVVAFFSLRRLKGNK